MEWQKSTAIAIMLIIIIALAVGLGVGLTRNGGGGSDNTFRAVVTANLAATNKFWVDPPDGDFGLQPTLTIKRGQSYKFELLGGLFGSGDHPFLFSTNSAGQANPGDRYDTGVTYNLDGLAKSAAEYISEFSAATTSRTISINVASSAPGTLYYYCHNHSGMGGKINVVN